MLKIFNLTNYLNKKLNYKTLNKSLSLCLFQSKFKILKFKILKFT